LKTLKQCTRISYDSSFIVRSDVVIYEGFSKGQNFGHLVHLGANCNEVLKLMCVTTVNEITFVIFLFVQPGQIRMAERELWEKSPSSVPLLL